MGQVSRKIGKDNNPKTSVTGLNGLLAARNAVLNRGSGLREILCGLSCCGMCLNTYTYIHTYKILDVLPLPPLKTTDQ